MTCADVQESSELFVLGALDPVAAAEIRAHLSACPECRVTVASAREVARLLALAVPPVDPPAKLRKQLLSAAGFEGLEHGGAEPRHLRGRLRGGATRPPWFRVAAVAATLLLFMSGWLTIEVSTLRQQMGAATYAVSSSRESAQAVVEVMHRAIAFGGAMARVQGTEMAPAADAELYYVPSERQAIFVADGLPRLKGNEVYQLWLIRGERRASGGILPPQDGGRAMLIVKSPMPLADVEAVGVTNEPFGGSTQPSGRRYMWGQLTRRRAE